MYTAKISNESMIKMQYYKREVMMIAQLGVDGNYPMAVTYGRLVDKITFFSEYLREGES